MKVKQAFSAFAINFDKTFTWYYYLDSWQKEMLLLEMLRNKQAVSLFPFGKTLKGQGE